MINKNKACCDLTPLTNYIHRINAEISWQAKKLPVEFTNMEKYRMFQSKVFLLSEHPSFWNYFVNLEHCVTICDPRWRVSSFLTWKPAGGFPAFWNLTSGGFPDSDLETRRRVSWRVSSRTTSTIHTVYIQMYTIIKSNVCKISNHLQNEPYCQYFDWRKWRFLSAFEI